MNKEGKKVSFAELGKIKYFNKDTPPENNRLKNNGKTLLSNEELDSLYFLSYFIENASERESERESERARKASKKKFIRRNAKSPYLSKKDIMGIIKFVLTKLQSVIGKSNNYHFLIASKDIEKAIMLALLDINIIQEGSNGDFFSLNDSKIAKFVELGVLTNQLKRIYPRKTLATIFFDRMNNRKLIKTVYHFTRKVEYYFYKDRVSENKAPFHYDRVIAGLHHHKLQGHNVPNNFNQIINSKNKINKFKVRQRESKRKNPKPTNPPPRSRNKSRIKNRNNNRNNNNNSRKSKKAPINNRSYARKAFNRISGFLLYLTPPKYASEQVGFSLKNGL